MPHDERATGLTRRRLLQVGATAAIAAGSARLAAPPVARAAGPILKPLPPEWFVPFGTNAEMRWDTLSRQYLVPNERFFVRNHTATPEIDVETWRLRLFGNGLRGGTVEWSYDDLRRLPARSLTVAIECAGNGRSFFASQQGTPATGTAWGLGAIGVAKWRGVPLSELLERSGLDRAAVDVLPQGLDASFVSGGVDYGRVRRPLPIGKALDDVLVAYEMNGEPLPPDHGFPARLVVPGWIGIASIKWLGQIEVSTTPLLSPWNTRWYRLSGGAYPAGSPPITTQVVKSALELARGARLKARKPIRLTGRSWSGTSAIERVDVSVDSGATWLPAELHKPEGAGTWSRWETTLPPLPPGTHELLARATDADGRTQPATVPYNENGYLFGAVVRHPVTVA